MKLATLLRENYHLIAYDKATKKWKRIAQSNDVKVLDDKLTNHPKYDTVPLRVVNADDYKDINTENEASEQLNEGAVKRSIEFDITKVAAYVKKATGLEPKFQNLKPKFGGPTQRTVVYENGEGSLLSIYNDGYVVAGKFKDRLDVETEVTDLEELVQVINDWK